jgi:ERCC4-related helicase
LDAIKKHFDVTDNIEEFNNSNKTIALQIISGREGINLSSAEALVYYNIDFSAISYWQSRDRMTTINRKRSDIFWVFAKDGIEWQIYKAVSKKKDFVLQTFKKWQVNTKPKS